MCEAGGRLSVGKLVWGGGDLVEREVIPVESLPDLPGWPKDHPDVVVQVLAGKESVH